ncbi:MAG: hypothetical protein ACOC8X_11555 [Chloroflexota bacterium]
MTVAMVALGIVGICLLIVGRLILRAPHGEEIPGVGFVRTGNQGHKSTQLDIQERAPGFRTYSRRDGTRAEAR